MIRMSACTTRIQMTLYACGKTSLNKTHSPAAVDVWHSLASVQHDATLGRTLLATRRRRQNRESTQHDQQEVGGWVSVAVNQPPLIGTMQVSHTVSIIRLLGWCTHVQDVPDRSAWLWVVGLASETGAACRLTTTCASETCPATACEGHGPQTEQDSPNQDI
jgi:hypothetical protein